MRLRELFWGERAYLTYWYAFLISFPFTWRKVLIPSVSGGSFNEYLDISVYVGDILILSTLILIIKHNKSVKSIFTDFSLFHVEHKLLALLFAYLFLSFFWSENVILWFEGIGSFLRFFAILSVFVFSLRDKNCSTWNNLRGFVAVIALATLLQSSIGIAQFISNQSLGLSVLGESKIGEFVSGVAKIDFDNCQQVRAYGTFLHPNIFGGYLVINIILIFTFLIIFRHKLFHVEHIIFYCSIILAFLALILTFSKTAIVSILIIFGMYMFHVEHKKQKKLFRVEQLIFTLTLVATFLVFYTLGNEQITKSINERLFLFKINFPTEEEVVIGKGLGQSVYLLDATMPTLPDWQLQPAHNAYAAIFSDLGLIGTLLIFTILYKYLSNVPRGTKIYSYFPIISLSIIGLADHYLWDIYTGTILVSLATGWCTILSRLLTKHK